MASARPQISVQGTDKFVATPAVLVSPIRPDLVESVHTRMRKNARQAVGVAENAGMQHSAESWGTGRAVARIPRVSGSGTARAAQAAFGNMVRKGRMFAPKRTDRKWHVRVNTQEKRYAVASALAASALPALVMGRGHKIQNVPEVPLVVQNSTESITKTKKAIELLSSVGGYDDVIRARNSKKLRAGKGKMRNRRHVMRRGPLIVYNQDNGVVKAFRNLPGVELCQVDRLNLLQLAPGGHVGRFIVWTQAAFERLDSIWNPNAKRIPRNVMVNSDITRIINSDEVQSKLRAANKVVVRRRLKKNPLKNLGVMVRLNPYALTMKRTELRTQATAAKRKADAKQVKADKAHRPTKKANFARINKD